MAKADQQSTSITWTRIRDIFPIVLEICGSPQYCGPWLFEQIANCRVRWQAKATRPPDEPLDNFWQGSPPSIDFEQCTATKLVPAPPGTVVGLVSITLFGLEVVREDIEALGPPKQAQIRGVLDSPLAIQGDPIPPHRNVPPIAESPKSTRGRDPELSDKEIAAAIKLLQTENKKEREKRGKDLKKNSAVSLLKEKMLRNGRPIPIDDRTWRRQIVWKVLPKRTKQSRTDK
jgi:hypothetical protein